MWNALTRKTAPTDQPLSLAEAKAHLRVDHDDDDAMITALINAALASIEGPYGRGLALLTQTWVMTLDSWYGHRYETWWTQYKLYDQVARVPVRIPLGPVREVTAIKYIDAGGIEQTIGAATYRVDVSQQPARVSPEFGAIWPTHRFIPAPISIEFTAGFADERQDLPADLVVAIKLLLKHFYDNRDAVLVTSRESRGVIELPWGVESIVSRYAPAAIA